ncbi:M23 family metallopeptidase [Plantactinospora sp. CA-290183]|uniref:M23 family metallopeptidase n=1 Tax=Plantactinospora sp. CA-290183 TaxID=3240006 RepID=UPI003D8AB2E2
MSVRALVSLAIVVTAAFILVCGGLAGMLGGAAATCLPAEPATASDSSTHATAASPPSWRPVGQWNSRQVTNAAAIVTTGARLRVPARGWVIAVATAMQESTLHNLPGGDRDSVGLFQQRPSQGWGTPQQLRDPVYAAEKFYRELTTVAGWQRMPLSAAAQAVQISAYPDAYAKWEPDATLLVTTISGATTLPSCDPAAVSAQGWTRPVPGHVGSGYRTAHRPGHDGVDIGAPHNSVIRAAAAGVVARVRCNIGNTSHEPNGAPTRCDRDGYPGLGGCGWYLDIRHPGDIVSRYCHMVKEPGVRVGQSVIAGQPIGLVGSSGNSSGPHLHFEIHLGYPATANNATEPVAFMRARGVPM